MISPTESLPLASARKPRKHRAKTLADYDLATRRYFLEVAHRFCAPLPSQEPFDWCVDNVVFADTEVTGPFNPVGREFLRDIINDIDDTENREHTVICATGTGKTTSVMCRHHWTIVHNPRRAIMVMPATKGAGGSETYVTSRFIPSLEATRATRELMPDGQRRLFMNSKKVRINGSHFDFVGGGSPSAVASNRCSLIEIDELDKLKDKLGNEAGTKKLVDERTEGVKDYTVFQSTTPTVETAQGWKSLLRSDFRRRFLPCPHCNPTASRIGHRGTEATEKNSNSPSLAPIGDLCVSVANLKGWFDLAWSEQYCVLPTKFHNGVLIPRAYIKWDDEAKRKDGEWDRDRIVRSVRLECPHCKGHIRDEHKIWMDKNGVWLPLQENNGHKGYHLSALYAPPLVTRDEDPTHKSRLAGRALKFLDATEDGEGMKGFINSTLAEVDVSQEHSGNRDIVEISSRDEDKVSSVQWWYDLSVDRQAKYPGFWYRSRRWCASVLRPQMNDEARKTFLAQMPGELKTVSEKIAPLPASKDAGLYSPSAIMAQIQRTDHWPKIADWLIGNGLTGAKLTEFFQVEFQTDLIRMLEFICKQDSVNLKLGKQGDSECVEFGSADSWEEIDEVQRRWKIANPDVIVDARFGALDNAEVFAECFRRCPPPGFCYYSPLITPFGPRGKFSKTPMPGYRPFAEWGWTPALGYPEHKQWASKEKIRLPYTQEVNDPFTGKMEARQFYQYVFKFDAQWALSELARIRKRYSFTLAHDCKFAGHNALMQPVTKADYDQHMKGYFWNERDQCWDAPGKRGGSQSRAHPNHLYDCEKNGAARAVWKGIFRYERSSATTSND